MHDQNAVPPGKEKRPKNRLSYKQRTYASIGALEKKLALDLMSLLGKSIAEADPLLVILNQEIYNDILQMITELLMYKQTYTPFLSF